MRKNLIIRFLPLLALLFTTAFVSSCKRGEEDPFFSLRSRDKRVMGEWVVSTIESRQELNSSSNSNVTNTIIEMKYSGDNMVVDTSITTNTTTYKRTLTSKEYSSTLNIMEGGVLEGVEKFSDETVTGTGITGATTNIQSIKNSIKGYWKWGHDDKNKGTLTLSTGGTGMAFGGFGIVTYQIQKLTDKEIVLIYADYDKSERTYPGLAITEEAKRSIKVILKQGE
jgi:hypothetical protein